MIKYIKKDGGEPVIELEGNLTDTLADLGFLIHVIHVMLSNSNVFVGQLFENALKDPEFMERVFKPTPADAEILKTTKGGFTD